MVREKMILMLLFAGAVSMTSAASAGGLTVRAMAGGGYTLVNFEAASGYPDSSLDDWDQGHYSFSLQALWQVSPVLRAGAEGGWEQLYYWYYVIPYGYPGPVYREANWATTFVGGIAQLFLSRSVYVLGGADLHFFGGGGTALGLSAGIGAEFRLNKKIALPLEFRIKPVFGAGTPTVIQVNTGLVFITGR